MLGGVSDSKCAMLAAIFQWQFVSGVGYQSLLSPVYCPYKAVFLILKNYLSGNACCANDESRNIISDNTILMFDFSNKRLYNLVYK